MKKKKKKVEQRSERGRRLRELDKLRLTRTQWKGFAQWVLYGLALVLTVVLQNVILNRIALFGLHINLVPCLVGCVCVIEGPDRGSVFALLAGLFWASVGGDYGFVSILVLTMGGMGIGLLLSGWLRVNVLSCVVLCLLLALVNDGIIFLLRLFLHTVRVPQYWRISLPSTLISGVFCPAYYYLFRVFHRVGGAANCSE